MDAMDPIQVVSGNSREVGKLLGKEKIRKIVPIHDRKKTSEEKNDS